MEKNEKIESVKSFFSDNGIVIPIAVGNAIDDVFLENEDLDGVDVYTSREKDDLQRDLSIKNEVYINVSKESSGNVMSSFTYYGNIEFSVSDKYFLKQEDELVDVLVDSFNREETVIDFSDWAVVLIETISFENKDYKKELNLKIYCPEIIEEVN